MNLNAIWSNLEDSFDPLNADAYSRWQTIAAEQRFEPGWLSWVAAIFVFNGEPFSTSEFMQVFAYSSERVLATRFEAAVAQGILAVGTDHKYRATGKGKDGTSQMIQVADAMLASLQPIPTTKLQELVAYLKQIVQSSLAMPEPPSKFGVTHYYRNMHPPEDASLLRLFAHYFSTLDKYRGNAHLAAWKNLGIQGNRWEVLSSIWRSQANTLDQLFGELSFRGFTREEYAQFLQELGERGWIEEDKDAYQLTAEGKRIRAEAEALTDKYFFAAWSFLSEAEVQDLYHLATALRDGLRNNAAHFNRE